MNLLFINMKNTIFNINYKLCLTFHVISNHQKHYFHDSIAMSFNDISFDSNRSIYNLMENFRQKKIVFPSTSQKIFELMSKVDEVF